MIILPIGNADATILLEVLERLPGGEGVVRAISAAAFRAGMYHLSLTTPDAQWLHDQLVPIQRALLAHPRRSGKQRQTVP